MPFVVHQPRFHSMYLYLSFGSPEGPLELLKLAEMCPDFFLADSPHSFLVFYLAFLEKGANSIAMSITMEGNYSDLSFPSEKVSSLANQWATTARTHFSLKRRHSFLSGCFGCFLKRGAGCQVDED